MAKMHAQELWIKELQTKLESKSHYAENKQRVIEMWKAQNQELNLKLIKLVEDKDNKFNKLSEQLDSKFAQLLKEVSERFVQKDAEKIVSTSQQGGDKIEEQMKISE